MANVDRPNGFKPVGTINGSPWTGFIRAYEADASSGSIFVGDLVIMEDDGFVAPATAGATALLGVCVGALEHMPVKVGGITSKFMAATSPTGRSHHLTGSAGVVLVTVGPHVIYEAQEDDGGTALTVAAIGSNADILATAGSTTTGLSAMEIDRSTITDGSPGTAQLKIIGLVDRPDNALGDWARWLVTLNENHITDATGL
jgi:hypothetical protein